MKAQCPECENNIDLRPGAELGDPIICPECGVQLEIVSLKPIELDYALELDEGGDEEWEDDEDWEDDDWDDEDEDDYADDDDDDLWEDEEDEEPAGRGAASKRK